MGATTLLALAFTAVASGVIAFAVRRPETIVGRPRLVLGLLLAISVAAAASLLQPVPFEVRMRLDPSEEPLLALGDPARDVYEQAIRNFGDDDMFFLSMRTESSGGRRIAYVPDTPSGVRFKIPDGALHADLEII